MVIQSRGNISFINGLLWVLGDGNWSTDQMFSACDKTCGFGEKRKPRACTNPAPFNGGKYCEGFPYVVAACNEFNCPSKKTALL